MLADAFEVHESCSREEALDLIRDIGDVDVAIVDMRWRQNGSGPSISGTDTIRALRRDSAAIGIVAHGERPERHLASAALQAGASAYVARTAAPEELRQAITLREVEGLSYEEIAETMDCPIGTVRSRIFRAREAIDARLRPLMDSGRVRP